MRSKPLSSMAWLLLLAVTVSVLSYGPGTEALAGHNKNASRERLEEVLKNRLGFTLGGGKPLLLKPIPVRPSDSPRTLNDGQTALPAGIQRSIARSAIISVLYYDGEKIKYDWRRNDIPEDALLFGYSMTKSIVAYLVGKAYCKGRIESLEDQIKKYVPQLGGTFYGNTSIIDALNMASGDSVLFSNAPRANRNVVKKVFRGVPIIDTLRGLGNQRHGERIFDYSPGNSLAIGTVLVSVSPEGFDEFAGKALADDAGLASPSKFLGDKTGMPQTSGRYYATRTDWLRLAIRIAERFRSEGCMGDYLRSAITESVPTGRRSPGRYGKYFRFDYPEYDFDMATMVGHGGQRAFMDIEKGRVLVIHTMRKDYKSWRFVNAIFE